MASTIQIHMSTQTLSLRFRSIKSIAYVISLLRFLVGISISMFQNELLILNTSFIQLVLPSKYSQSPLFTTSVVTALILAAITSQTTATAS